MKYTHRKNKVTVKDWVKDQTEYLKIVTFVLEVFKDRGLPLSRDIPVPRVKIAKNHFNDDHYTFCVDSMDTIYLNDKLRAKPQAQALITSLVDYYARTVHPTEDKSRIMLRDAVMGEMYTHLTIAEIAVASTAITGGILAVKSLFK